MSGVLKINTTPYQEAAHTSRRSNADQKCHADIPLKGQLRQVDHVLEVLRADFEKRGAKTIEDVGMRSAVFIECIAKPSGVELN